MQLASRVSTPAGLEHAFKFGQGRTPGGLADQLFQAFLSLDPSQARRKFRRQLAEARGQNIEDSLLAGPDKWPDKGTRIKSASPG